MSPETSYHTPVSADTDGTHPMTLLDVFADDLVPVGPNMSNASTPPSNTDFDDQQSGWHPVG